MHKIINPMKHFISYFPFAGTVPYRKRWGQGWSVIRDGGGGGQSHLWSTLVVFPNIWPSHVMLCDKKMVKLLSFLVEISKKDKYFLVNQPSCIWFVGQNGIIFTLRLLVDHFADQVDSWSAKSIFIVYKTYNLLKKINNQNPNLTN